MANRTNQIPIETGKTEYMRPPIATRFKPGNKGGPGRPPAAGASWREWVNVMQDWPVGRLAAALADPATPAVKRAAAWAWVDACSTDRTAGGRPVAGADLEVVVKFGRSAQ